MDRANDTPFSETETRAPALEAHLTDAQDHIRGNAGGAAGPEGSSVRGTASNGPFSETETRAPYLGPNRAQAQDSLRGHSRGSASSKGSGTLSHADTRFAHMLDTVRAASENGDNAPTQGSQGNRAQATTARGIPAAAARPALTPVTRPTGRTVTENRQPARSNLRALPAPGARGGPVIRLNPVVQRDRRLQGAQRALTGETRAPALDADLADAQDQIRGNAGGAAGSERSGTAFFTALDSSASSSQSDASFVTAPEGLSAPSAPGAGAAAKKKPIKVRKKPGTKHSRRAVYPPTNPARKKAWEAERKKKSEASKTKP